MWHRLPVKQAELRLDITLVCGQSFRWRQADEGVWRGVLFGNIWSLKQADDVVLYRRETTHDLQHSHLGSVEGEEKLEEALLHDYFQLSVNLENLYKHWSDVDSHFAQTASEFGGVRILRQDPVENLFSFICSSNNNISRITLLVEKLATNFGVLLGEVNGVQHYSFPSIEALAAEGVEAKLRSLAFGYRAKYIHQTAKTIRAKGVDWLLGLRQRDYAEAKTELMKLSGVGAKVADCVCLMSLDKAQSVPVDTHVWQFTQKHYLPQLRAKTLSDALYRRIGDHFRELWGAHAGWAQSVMFSAELKAFQSLKHKQDELDDVDKKRKKKVDPST